MNITIFLNIKNFRETLKQCMSQSPPRSHFGSFFLSVAPFSHQLVCLRLHLGPILHFLSCDTMKGPIMDPAGGSFLKKLFEVTYNKVTLCLCNDWKYASSSEDREAAMSLAMFPFKCQANLMLFDVTHGCNEQEVWVANQKQNSDMDLRTMDPRKMERGLWKYDADSRNS